MSVETGARPERLRLAIVTNIPAPYRVPVYNRIAAMPDVDLRVYYAARSEPDRQWDLPAFAHEHVFLQGRMLDRGGRFIHNNPAVWPALAHFGPHVVLTTGYNPTHLYAWAYTLLHRCKHVVMTDGTDRSEVGLGRVHRLVRRVVATTTPAFRGGKPRRAAAAAPFMAYPTHASTSRLCAPTPRSTGPAAQAAHATSTCCFLAAWSR